MDLSILIVSYNTRELTRACLRSLYAETRDLDFEVLVVDNASADGSARMLAEEFPSVRLFALDVNEGFARAVNRAAAEASGDYLLLLNPDTVVHGGALQELWRFAREHPQHGIYGGRTLAPDGRVDPSSCWGCPTLWSLFCFAVGLSTAFKRSRWLDPESLGGWQRDSVREVGVVTGCLCLVARDVWQQLGGFDARFFMYGEDTDLSMRAAARGWRPVITPRATVTHFVGASSARRADKTILVMRGKATLVRRHFSGPARPLGLAFLALGVGLRALLAWLASAAGRSKGRAWAEVWAARADWLPGYASLPGSR